MIWVGSFQSLRSALRKPPSGAPLEVRTWQRSETGLISPLADWLMSLIARSRCVRGKEEFVELALREAVSNAMLHGNRMDARKLVHVRCCCESTKGVFIVVRDQGSGFDPNNVPNPLAVENLMPAPPCATRLLHSAHWRAPASLRTGWMMPGHLPTRQ